jgi:amino acid adenylation domain-containing protein
VGVLYLDADAEVVGEYPSDNPRPDEVGLISDHLAYVIYTSGSTGRPKGVAIQRSGLLNLIAWHNEGCGITKNDHITQFASLSFDASVWEIWPALSAGASLYIVEESARVNPAALPNLLQAAGITVAFLPTPIAEAVLNLDWPRESSLRYLHTGGDKLHYSPPQIIPFAFINNYGPTENTVATTACVLRNDTSTQQAPPIGKPIANVQVYVVDEEMNPVPMGVRGELYIGGDGLARAYLNRPELTAERFVPNPFATGEASSGQRLYRTGDITRWLADGNLEFLGRLDQQVKMRGFRIELGEIEAALQEHAAVQQAVVIAREDELGYNRLVAYLLVDQGEAEIQSIELREQLKGRLPDYMVPAHYVVLDELPLTPNGKLDRKALPAPDDSSLVGEYIAPATETEITLAQIWADLLKIEPNVISATANLFELGGHSLLLVRLISEIRNKFAVELSIRDVIRYAQLKQLAEQIVSAAMKDALTVSSQYEIGADEMEITI